MSASRTFPKYSEIHVINRLYKAKICMNKMDDIYMNTTGNK